jgi:hypothetical protein
MAKLKNHADADLFPLMSREALAAASRAERDVRSAERLGWLQPSRNGPMAERERFALVLQVEARGTPRESRCVPYWKPRPSRSRSADEYPGCAAGSGHGPGRRSSPESRNGAV